MGAVTDRFLAQIDHLEAAKQAGLAKSSQKAGIATYDKDSKIEQAFAWLFGKTIEVNYGSAKTILNVNSAKAFLLRNKDLVEPNWDNKSWANMISGMSREAVAKCLEDILNKNTAAQGMALDYMKPQDKAKDYIAKYGQDSYDMQTHTKRLEVKTEGPFEGTKDQVLSFVQHLSGAGLEIRKEQVDKWLANEKNGQISVPRSEIDSLVLEARKKQGAGDNKKTAHTPKEIQAYINSVKEIVRKEKPVTFVPMDAHDDGIKQAVASLEESKESQAKRKLESEALKEAEAIKLTKGTVSSALQQLLPNEKITSVTQGDTKASGNTQQMARQLLQKVTGLSRNSAASQANYAERLLEKFGEIDGTERKLYKALCLKSGYFSGDQLTELQKM